MFHILDFSCHYWRFISNFVPLIRCPHLWPLISTTNVDREAPVKSASLTGYLLYEENAIYLRHLPYSLVIQNKAKLMLFRRLIFTQASGQFYLKMKRSAMNLRSIHSSASRKAFCFTHFCTSIFEYLNSHISNPLPPFLSLLLTYLLLDSSRCY